MEREPVRFDHATGRFIGIHKVLLVDLVMTYQNVRVIDELRKMRFWLREHPTNKGDLQFIVRWLNRASVNSPEENFTPAYEDSPELIEPYKEYLEELWKGRESLLDQNTLQR